MKRNRITKILVKRITDYIQKESILNLERNTINDQEIQQLIDSLQKDTVTSILYLKKK